MTQHELKHAFLNNRRVYGTLIASPSPKWAAEIEKIGADFVFIDCEHMPLDRATRAWMCRYYAAKRIAPIVRIPFCSAHEAFAAMEDGAAGIVCPYTETPEQIDELIGAVKYRPLKGKRLQQVLRGEVILTPKETAYFKTYNDGCLLILNIESLTAVERLDELLAKPEVDAVFIGPHDLSINMGIPEEYDSPAFERCVETIITACNNRRVGVGNHYSGSLDKQIRWAQKGMNIVVWSSDIALFVKTVSANFNTVKQALEETETAAQTDVTI